MTSLPFGVAPGLPALSSEEQNAISPKRQWPVLPCFAPIFLPVWSPLAPRLRSPVPEEKDLSLWRISTAAMEKSLLRSKPTRSFGAFAFRLAQGIGRPAILSIGR